MSLCVPPLVTRTLSEFASIVYLFLRTGPAVSSMRSGLRARRLMSE